MIVFYVGEGLSGVVPSLLGLVQGAGGDTCYADAKESNPRFSVNVYFVILSVLMVISFMAFFLLNILPVSLEERYEAVRSRTPSPDEMMPAEVALDIKNLKVIGVFNPQSNLSDDYQKDLKKVRNVFIIMYCITFVVCGLGNGVIPAIQSYACLPYGPVAYHLAIELGLLANPIMCFAAFFIPCMSPTILSILCAVACSIAGVIIWTASLSPTPWLLHDHSGPALIVVLCVLWMGTISYIKVCVATVLRKYGENALIWCGVATQIGSCVGAILIFVVNMTVKPFTAC